MVDITGDLEISEDGGLTVLTEMEPLGELTISTHGQGNSGEWIGEGGLGQSPSVAACAITSPPSARPW